MWEHGATQVEGFVRHCLRNLTYMAPSQRAGFFRTFYKVWVVIFYPDKKNKCWNEGSPMKRPTSNKRWTKALFRTRCELSMRDLQECVIGFCDIIWQRGPRKICIPYQANLSATLAGKRCRSTENIKVYFFSSGHFYQDFSFFSFFSHHSSFLFYKETLTNRVLNYC